jgi:drug/metabolite transporter (DMT)-like permease
MMDWKRKLGSRKFWALLAALVGAVLIFFNYGQASIEKIVALIGAFGSVIVYILVEGNVDSKAVQK